MATKAKSKTKASRARQPQRYTSNVFSMFNQSQIQEFKEAFNMMDQNHDQFIDRDDLFEMFTSLGRNPTEAQIAEMLKCAPPGEEKINFTMFLTMFGEKLTGTDPEDVIRNAFACFDPDGTGMVSEERLREAMTSMGDRWTDEQVDELLNGAPLKNGQLLYPEFTKQLKNGTQDPEDLVAPPTAAPVVAAARPAPPPAPARTAASAPRVGPR